MDYREHFDARGRSYDQAMRSSPEARRQEFLQAVERASLEPGMHVADVPAGGAYLARFLPQRCVWRGHEPSAGFDADAGPQAGTGDSGTLLPLPWYTNAMGAAISIAGVHHMADKAALFTELRRVVRPGGRFVLSDVETESPQAWFLDDYVDANTDTGHRGFYLGKATEATLEDCGWRCLGSERVCFHWVFDGYGHMGRFCRSLFGLTGGSIDDTIAAIESRLGAERLADGRIGMRWALRTVVVE